MALTEREHKHRSTGLGGSDLGAMLGLSKWKTPLKLWREKTGRDKQEDIGHLPHIYFGNRLENFVCEEFEIQTGKETKPDTYTDEDGKERPKLHRHPEHQFMVGMGDRLVVGEAAGLEAKTGAAWVAQQWGTSQAEAPEIDTDDIPLYYLTQVTHYMAVYDLPKWYVAVLLGGNDFRWYTVHRDLELEAELIRREAIFWAHVENDVAPDAQTMSDIALMFPQADKKKSIVVPPDLEQTITDLYAAKAALKQWQDREAALKLAIASRMEDAYLLTDSVGGKVARLQTTTRNTVSGKALKAEDEALFEKLKKTSVSRSLVLY